MIICYEKIVACTRVCATSWLNGVILIGESLLYGLVQEPSSYVVPGLRYEGKYKLHLIIGNIRYIITEVCTSPRNFMRVGSGDETS